MLPPDSCTPFQEYSGSKSSSSKIWVLDSEFIVHTENNRGDRVVPYGLTPLLKMVSSDTLPLECFSWKIWTHLSTNVPTYGYAAAGVFSAWQSLLQFFSIPSECSTLWSGLLLTQKWCIYTRGLSRCTASDYKWRLNLVFSQDNEFMETVNKVYR